MSEYQRLYWKIRETDDRVTLSRTHLFTEDTRFALCGRAVPRSAIVSVMWDDTENNDHLCQRCLMSARKR